MPSSLLIEYGSQSYLEPPPVVFPSVFSSSSLGAAEEVEVPIVMTLPTRLSISMESPLDPNLLDPCEFALVEEVKLGLDFRSPIDLIPFARCSGCLEGFRERLSPVTLPWLVSAVSPTDAAFPPMSIFP